MVTQESVEAQLKKIGVNYRGWGRSEINELRNIILPDEEIYECVNGLYEGGFALAVATNIRVVLVDKKPLKYLTVEDLRFDMINEIDYSHRMIGAQISISTGSKNLRFMSLNQPRLRKLIGHVQSCMAESKQKHSEHEESQKLHLEQINRQLQAYLLAQHQQQQKIQQHLEKNSSEPFNIEPVRPSPELSDYLYAQGLLARHQNQGDNQAAVTAQPQPLPATDQADQQEAGTGAAVQQPAESGLPAQPAQSDPSPDDLYAEGRKEIFGNQSHLSYSDALNPLRIAYSKLPLALRNKKFGRPSFHAHSQQEEMLQPHPEAYPEALAD